MNAAVAPLTATLPPSGGETSVPRPPRAHACHHCGAPLLDARMEASGFCCAGCRYVYRLVQEQGLGAYYRIKDEVTAPADAAVFQPRDYTWLQEAQHRAEEADGIPELTLGLQGVSCAACVWLIERIFSARPGTREAVVNPQYGTLRLRWVRGEFSAADFARHLQGFGYLVGPAGAEPEDSEARALVRRIGLCAAFAMNVMLFSLPAYFGMERTFEWAGLFGLLNAAFATLSVLVGGLYFLQRAGQALRGRSLHLDLPISIGIIGAYTGSIWGWLTGEERYVYFDFVATFILLMLVGRWAQVAAVERNRRRLLPLQPQVQPVRTADGRTLPVGDLARGQEVVLPSGHTLPVGGRLLAAIAEFSLASINGESEPRTFRAGQTVPAGALSVGREPVHLTVLETWRESLLSRLLEAGQRPPARHPLLERIVRGYVAGILLVAAAAGLAWGFATGDLLRTGAVVTAVLVVSCPCAIALAFPLADEIATVALRRRGVFIREPDLWPRLARVRQLAFDKTGTLTLEAPALRNPEALAELTEEARSALFTLVRDNPHPVSQSLLESLLALGSPAPLTGEVRETIGCGVELGAWSLGRPGWKAGGTPPGADAGTELRHDGQLISRFLFQDTARPDARSELAALQQRGLGIRILSGDQQAKVDRLSRELGLPPEVAHGELSPADKAAWLGAHGAEGTLMLGDGANDSLAFDQALCRGTPVVHRGVLERKADFYYLGRGIGGLRALLETDEVRRRTHAVILTFSAAYNLLAVGLAVAGHMSPLLAAILMPVNSLATLLIVTAGMRGCLRDGSRFNDRR